MQFNDFELLFSKLATDKKLVKKAHQEAAPYRALPPDKAQLLSAKMAAVLLLVYPSNTTSSFVLIKRPTYNGAHSNQIALPGGKVEPQDENLSETAMREAHEEVNILPSQIIKTTPLTPIYIPLSNFLVSPFLAISNTPPNFIKEEREVDKILQIPVSDLLKHTILPTTDIKTSSKNTIQSPYFSLNNEIVWGATAMVLNEFKHLLKSVI